MKYSYLLFLFVLPLLLWSQEQGEIRVRLTTESPLSPLYVAKIEEGDGSYKAYTRKLQGVLEFDLMNAGYFKVVKEQLNKEKQIWKKNPKEAFKPKTWKEWGIAYAIRGSVAHNTLRLYVLDVQKQSLKQFEEIPLTGEITKDRRQIHKLCDALNKALLNKDSVACSRLLYSLQVKNSVAEDKKWRAEIWECDWDGANARRVTSDKSYNVSPVFVPKRGKSDPFLYVSYQVSQPKVYMSSRTNGKKSRVLSLKGNQLLPAMSPNRDMIAFISDAAGRPDLFTQKLSPTGKEVGKPVQLFSYPRSTQASPTFSPDGKKIAFVSDKDGRPRIYLIPAKSPQKRPAAKLLTKKNPESSCPNWSPDGRKIAYSAKTSGVRQIWIYDLEKEEEKQLTFGPGNKENPCFGPDSLHLVFNSTDSDVSELYIVNLNQPDAVKITSGPGKKHYPAWGKG